MRKAVSLLVAFSLLAPWQLVLAATTAAATKPLPQPDLPKIEQRVVFYDAGSFEERSSFTFPKSVKGLSMDMADFGVDGRDELVIGSGSGEAPEVIILRADGSEMKRFPAYTPGYRGGVNVAAGHIDTDGMRDVVTGTRRGGGPHVRVFAFRGELMAEWFAYDAASRAGVNVAVGELDAKRPGEEIITAPGEGEPALLRVFSARGERLAEWYPFGEEYTGGVNVSVAPNGWVLAGRAFGASPLVRAYNAAGVLQSEVMAYVDGFAGGVQATGISRNGHIEILTVPGFSGGPHVRNFALDGSALSPGFMALDGAVRAGLTMATGDLDADGHPEIAVAVREVPNGPAHGIKTIFIDLSEQRLWTYERANMVKTYLISSGTTKFPTPTGEYAVSLKRDKTRMSWFYGPDNPDNYDLKDVPWVLTFKAPYNIHGAYWHNNFGRRMSHGCVNMSVSDSKEVYEWADLGTVVVIQP